jgi:uncharacterized protein (TIGR02266 family)
MARKSTKTAAPKTEENKATKKPSAEDRTDHRVPIQMLVDYKSGGNYLFDFCRDLGTGGVFIESQQPLPVGSEMELTFTIPDSKETLRTSGKVIWSQPPIAERKDVASGMGVQFSNFSDANRKTLDKFIERYGASRGVGAQGRRAG